MNSGGSGGLEAASQERPRTLERLIDIDRAVNQSMTMLKRYPSLSKKLSQLMEDYIQALRSKDDTPGNLLAMNEGAEAAILDKYRLEIEHKVNERERQRLVEKQRKEQRSQEREKIREEKMKLQVKNAEKSYQTLKQKNFATPENKIVENFSSLKPVEASTETKDSTVETTEDLFYV